MARFNNLPVQGFLIFGRKNMKKALLFVFVALLFLLLAACAKEVQLTEEGKKVQVTDKLLNPDSCKKVSNIRVTNETTVEGWGLTGDELARALEVNARNLAAADGANVIIPKGPPENDAQNFESFNCE